MVCENEVPSLKIVTLAPGITRPCYHGSAPWIVPVSTCPNNIAAKPIKMYASTNRCN